MATYKYGTLWLVLMGALLCTAGCGSQPAPTLAPTLTRSISENRATTPTATPTPARPTGEPEEPPVEEAESITPIAPTLAVELPRYESEEIARMAAELQGLPLDVFVDQSFIQLMLRSPEGGTGAGMAGDLSMNNDQLDNLSDTYRRETFELAEAILFLLRQYDRDAYSSEQQLTMEVYDWYLDDWVRGREFMYYGYPVHHFLGGYHDTRVRLFTEIHPMNSKQDAQDYATRLWAVDDQVEQVLENLLLGEQAGAAPPTFIIDLTIEAMTEYLQITGRDPTLVPLGELSVYTVFAEKLELISGLTLEEKEQLRAEALAAVESSYVPAYIALLHQLDHLATIATDDAGAWKFPNGGAYYAYRLRNQTSTEMSPEAIHQLGLAEVSRVQGQMRHIFAELNYPADESLSDLMQRVRDDAGYMDMRDQAGKDAVIARYEEILDEVDGRLDDYFDLRPEGKVVVMGGPDGGYYVPGNADGSRPGAFHISTRYDWAARYRMAPLSYHEAIPGHHFQIGIAQELDFPFFRNNAYFNAYTEGWALYAEHLAYEMGMYAADPYGN